MDGETIMGSNYQSISAGLQALKEIYNSDIYVIPKNAEEVVTKTHKFKSNHNLYYKNKLAAALCQGKSKHNYMETLLYKNNSLLQLIPKQNSISGAYIPVPLVIDEE